MKHRNSHLLVGYWSRLRKGASVPDQTAIDPRAIKRILSHVYILDAADTPHPRYRLAGTSQCDRYGMELRGTHFLARWDAESRATIAQLLRHSLVTGLPVCLSSVGESEVGMVEMETVLAPLSFAGNAPSRFIGISQLTSDRGSLLGNPIVCERLVASEFVQENDPLVPPDSFRPPPARPRPLGKSPHLRLVVSQAQPAAVSQADVLFRRLADALEIVTPKLHAVS